MKNLPEIGLGLLSFLIMAGAVGDLDYYTEIKYQFPLTETMYSLMLAAVILMVALIIYVWRHR